MTVIVLKSIGAEFLRLFEQEPQLDPHNIAEITDGIQHYSLIRAVTAFKATFEKVLASATSPCDFAWESWHFNYEEGLKSDPNHWIPLGCSDKGSATLSLPLLMMKRFSWLAFKRLPFFPPLSTRLAPQPFSPPLPPLLEDSSDSHFPHLFTWPLLFHPLYSRRLPTPHYFEFLRLNLLEVPQFLACHWIQNFGGNHFCLGRNSFNYWKFPNHSLDFPDFHYFNLICDSFQRNFYFLRL